MGRRDLLICAVLAAAAVANSEKLPAAQRPFRAAAAAVDVSPRRLPVSMTGSFQDRQAHAAHDPLHVRAVVLDDGRTRVAIAVCDSCLVTRDILDEAKQLAAETTGIPVDRMMISATHTHTAPTVVPLANCHPDPEYVAFFTRQIAQEREPLPDDDDCSLGQRVQWLFALTGPARSGRL